MTYSKDYPSGHPEPEFVPELPPKPMGAPEIVPGAPVEVVKTPWGAQMARALIAVLLAIGGALTFVGANQAQIASLFPNAKWIGGAMVICSLAARAIQEILAANNIHAVNFTER